jgi:penicillin-binding protein 1A
MKRDSDEPGDDVEPTVESSEAAEGRMNSRSEKPKTNASPRRRGLAALKLSLPLVVAVALGVPGGFLAARVIHVPLVETLDTYRPNVITTLLSRDGTVFAEYAIQRRMVVSKKDISPYLIDAIIATEDASFYQHGGVAPKAVARAIYKDLATGTKAEGASTLTMQLARQVFLTPEKSWRRKLNEVFLAIEIEKSFTKEQIFEMYANQVYLGDVYGVEAAARHYFGKHAKDLSIAEAAMIAGMIQRPSRLSPITYPTQALQRRNHVLRRMLGEKLITREEYDKAVASPIVLGTFKSEAPPVGAYFAEEVRQYLERNYGSDELYQSGLSVWTTLDLELQQIAENALKSGLHRFDHRKGMKKPERNLVDEGLDPSTFEDSGWDDPPLRNTLYQAVVKSVTRDEVRVAFAGRELTLGKDAWAWSRKPTLAGFLREGDLVHVRMLPLKDASDQSETWILDQIPRVQGAIVVLDTKTGETLASSGGYEFSRSKFNRSVQALRQPGSLFKTMVYAAAFERGFTVADTLFDSPITIEYDNQSYSPKNYTGEFSGIVTVQLALEKSINIPAVKTLMILGPDPVIDLSRRCGITAALPPYPSLALGSSGISLMEMTAAYNTFGNQGVYAKPHSIRRITDATQKVLEESVPELAEGVEAQTAYLVTHMLEAVIDRGTGYAAHQIPGSLAGKTGTTNGYTDAWFVGFSPEYAVGVWVGYDDPSKTLGTGATGADVALPIWMELFQKADEKGLRGEPKEFDVPPGVAIVPMDLHTGRRGAGPCRRVVQGAFLSGTEPTQDCSGEVTAVAELPFYLQRPAYTPRDAERAGAGAGLPWRAYDESVEPPAVTPPNPQQD